MTWLRQLWGALFCEGALLRAENARLRETNEVLELELEAVRKDNRALVNAQLKQAGVISLPDIEPAPQINRVRHFSLHQRQRLSVQRTSIRPDRAEAGK